jgi:hypothetical protein
MGLWGTAMQNYKKLLCLLILLLAGCGKTEIIREKVFIKKPSLMKTTIKIKKSEKPATTQHCDYITIYIHGTKLAPRALVRRIFHIPDGLVPAASLAANYHLRSIADTLSATDPVRFSDEYMFLFGWSGALRFEDREQAARDLYNQLKPVIKSYEQRYGHRPKLRIITHSHGGNVALNLSKIKDDSQFIIDELILLACPVQEATAWLIRDPMFKEVFVLYSSLDLTQIIDPQGLYSHNDDRPMWSQRRFPKQDNIIQVKLKLNGQALFHADFIRLKFMGMLPQIIDKMREFQKICLNEPNTNSKKVQQILSVYT